MKKLIRCTLLMVALAVPMFAQRGEYAEPVDADLAKYPLYPEALSLTQQAVLGLSAKKLREPVVVQNHFRSLRNKEGRFVLETLSAGTLVLADKEGKLRYKADCGNRIVELVRCPECPPVAVGKATTSGINPPASKPGFWQRLIDELVGFLLLLLGLALITLLAFLLYGLARWITGLIRNRGQRNNGGQQASPAPPVRPIPPAQPPAPGPVPVPAPQQAPVAPNPNPAPAPPPPAFPTGRVLIDLGHGNVPARIQAGQNITRVIYDGRDPNDGSVNIRIFEV